MNKLIKRDLITATYFLISISLIGIIALLYYNFQSPKSPAISNWFFSTYLKPIIIKNCTLERLGRKNDGGYIGCNANLGSPSAAFSYGIEGRDSWGCAVAKQYNIPVYQYDPYDIRIPNCNKKNPLLNFNPKGVAGHNYQDKKNRTFETFKTNLKQHNQYGKVIVKMDIEGNEWHSLQTSLEDGSYKQITQLILETHELFTAKTSLADTIRTVLKELAEKFYIVHLHANNFGCKNNKKNVLPGDVIEITYVNRNIHNLNIIKNRLPKFPNTLDSPNNINKIDCPVDTRIFNKKITI